MATWIQHVMKHKKPGMSLGDAMKAAKKTWKKGGTLMGQMGPMGGRRRGTRKAKVGGTAYGFTGGPYTNSDLPDGMSRWPSMSDATYQSTGSELLRGGRRSRRSRRGGAFAPSSDGKPAQLPYAEPSVAPDTAVGVNGTFAKSGDAPAAFGGRRRRSTKKAGRHRRGHRGGNQTVGSAMVYGAASSEAAAAARQAAAARNGHL